MSKLTPSWQRHQPPTGNPQPQLRPDHMALSKVRRRIINCQACPRLRAYCARIAQHKRRAFQSDSYWGRPVPGFGDGRARLVILGLAPAAHGANRTGRMFTGDSSGDTLMIALHVTGFANLPTSLHLQDGLTLSDAYITSVVRCAPPDNRPSANEIVNCYEHLQAEMKAVSRVRVVVALGRIAFDSYWRWLADRGVSVSPRPRFKHGSVYEPRDGPWLLASYHPSLRNRNTGRLTQTMFTDVFRQARALLDQVQSPRRRGSKV